jgi:hypothetical protein
MTDDFCMKCTEELFGPEAIEKIEREVAAAPPFSPEQVEKFRALFRTVRVVRRSEERPPKKCGH